MSVINGYVPHLFGSNVSAFQRITTLAKLTTVVSGLLTVLILIAVFVHQLFTLFHAGDWPGYSVGSVLQLLQTQNEVTYTTASIHDPTFYDTIVQTFMSIPIVGLLVLIALFHLGLFLYILSFARSFSSNR